MPSNPSSFTPLAGHRMLRKRSNSDRGHIYDGGVRRGTGRVARGLHNPADVDDQRVRVALERKGQTSSGTLSSTRLLFPLCSTCAIAEFPLFPNVGFARFRTQNNRIKLNALPLLDDCIEVEHTAYLLVLSVGGRRSHPRRLWRVVSSQSKPRGEMLLARVGSSPGGQWK